MAENKNPKAKRTIADKTPEKKTKKFAPKRTEVDKEKDRSMIMQLYIEGLNYRDISILVSEARDYSISYTTVGEDIKRCLEDWKAKRDDKVELYITIELAKIDALEREYWEAWKKSKNNYEQKSAKIIRNKGGKEIGGTIDKEETSVKQLVEFGDPRFLQGIERCIQKRIDLLGLDAAKNLNVNYKDVSETTVFKVKTTSLDDVEMKAVS